MGASLRSPRRFTNGVLRLVPLVLAAPVLATIWTRSMAFVRLSHGVRMPLQHVSYSTRDWTEELTAVEVREQAASFTADLASPQWLFSYRNTDSEAHFVAITVQCQDLDRHDRARFSYTATLAPTKNEKIVEITSRMKSVDWHATMFVRITVDFLSSPAG